MKTAMSIDPRVLPRPADAAAAAVGMADFLDRCSDDDDSGAMRAEAERRYASADVAALFEALFGNSSFLLSCALREPEWLLRLITEGPDKLLNEVLIRTRIETSKLTDEKDMMRALRIDKRRLALTAAAADLAGCWSLYRVTEALSDFADASTSAAAHFVLKRAEGRGAFRLAHPDDPARESGFIVIGMGKLGARELNYSSDIDLICLFDPEMFDTDDRDGLQNHVIRMTRTLARILDERTVDGYVFRVDLRLRPDPGSTPLAISVLAAETYYESLGQNWERAAMIKARPVAGDITAGNRFLKSLRPFMWRKSLDFAAIQDIHSIKRQIHAHKGGGEIAVDGHDIKTGRGGIREIEFFAQTQQLIWGGREPALRARRTIETINTLVDMGHVAPHVAVAMDDAYEFLRRVEHRLQMRADEQTQKLPTDEDAISALGIFCGLAGGDEFRETLLGHLKSVSYHYAALFEEAPSLALENGASGSLVFTGAETDSDTLQTLHDHGFESPEKVDAAIRAWHHGRIRATRSTRARELLTELTPSLLKAFSRQPDPDAAFLRFDAFLSGLPSGIQLFSLFQAYPDLLGLLAEIMGEAPRLATHLGRRPNLLDSVLSADFYDALPSKDILSGECARALTDAVFFEDILDATRRWNGDKQFQIGVQMLRGTIEPGRAARHFSDIADTVLQTLIPHVMTEYQSNHGEFPGGDFAVVALGKLGSQELTPSSDLDLVFVYDAPDPDNVSDGRRPLSLSQYYTRLGQRIISSIVSLTAEGKLYEVDMRLRPSGNKGPVASAFQGFSRYYREDAWTWEHLALARARVVFSGGELGRRIDETVRDVLTSPRDHDKSRADVVDMRGKIEQQFGTDCVWAIKQIPGGQVDVDFLAQFLILIHAAQISDIADRDSVKVFEVAERNGLISSEHAQKLIAAKILYRDLQTFLSLTVDGDISDHKVAVFSETLREDLTRIAGEESFDAATNLLQRTEVETRQIFETYIGEPN